MYVWMYIISPFLQDIPAFHPPLPPREWTFTRFGNLPAFYFGCVKKGDYSTRVLDYYALDYWKMEQLLQRDSPNDTSRTSKF
jgi:hypothetical protein